jgi:hypothetical protein
LTAVFGFAAKRDQIRPPGSNRLKAIVRADARMTFDRIGIHTPKALKSETS